VFGLACEACVASESVSWRGYKRSRRQLFEVTSVAELAASPFQFVAEAVLLKCL
jgi:hypothetical protein